MVIAELLGADATVAWIESLSPKASRALRTGVSDLAVALLRHVKEDKLSDQVLHVRTGNLRRSINQKVTEENGTFTGSVGTNLSYAAIHEFGGTIQRHVNERVMRFRLNAKGDIMRQNEVGMGPHRRGAGNLAVFAKASHKRAVEMKVKGASWTVHMPERSFLRSALADMAPEIQTGIEKAVREAIGAQ